MKADHERGSTSTCFVTQFMALHRNQDDRNGIHFVPFGLTLNLVSRLTRFPLLHSEGYKSTGDYSIYFASPTLVPEPFRHHAGEEERHR